MPGTGPTGTTTIWVGLGFGFSAPGRVAGIRMYCDASYDGETCGIFWNAATGHLLNVYKFRSRTTGAAGWHQAWGRPWVHVNTSDTYRLVIAYVGGNRFRRTTLIPSGGVVSANGIDVAHGFTSTAIFPPAVAITEDQNLNAIDVLFQAN